MKYILGGIYYTGIEISKNIEIPRGLAGSQTKSPKTNNNTRGDDDNYTGVITIIKTIVTNEWRIGK